MKLKEQIVNEAEMVRQKMNEYYKLSEDDTEAHDQALYYEGMLMALEWVIDTK